METKFKHEVILDSLKSLLKEWNESPNIENTRFDQRNSFLYITFKNGKTYRYIDVPKSVWDDMILAPSIGSFINRNLKGYFRYEQV